MELREVERTFAGESSFMERAKPLSRLTPPGRNHELLAIIGELL